MEQIVIPGVPSEYAAVIYTLIGLASSWLVMPLTALWKKLGRTSGVTTVTISAVLSLLTALVFAVMATTATGGPVNWLGVLVTAVIAFLKSNGDYLTRVQAVSKGASIATPAPVVPAPPAVTVGDILPPDGLILPRDGLSDIR